MIKGTAYVLQRGSSAPAGVKLGVEAELKRFRDAFDAVRRDVALSAEDDDIFAAHLEMLDDPMLAESIEAAVSEGLSADAAVRRGCSGICEMFAGIDDEYLRSRVDDVKDLCNQIERAIAGTTSVNPFAGLPEGTVIVAEELFPSDTSLMDFSKIAGFVTARGSTTSHVCIIARSKGIPALVGYDISGIRTGDLLTLEENCRPVAVTPDSPACGGVGTMVASGHAAPGDHATLGTVRGGTACGGVGAADAAGGSMPRGPVSIYCNAASVDKVKAAIDGGADGIGLFRTEFLFMSGTAMPTEDEQFETYAAALKACNGKPLTIRTLDVGGDKALPYLPMAKEDNPFLGLRGIRFCLAHPEILRPQLRALVRAAAVVEDSKLRIMIPMVDMPEEVLEVSAMLDSVKEELGLETVPVELGIMIETPSAVFNAAELATCCDFFSLGTNDLTQYVMAADRGNADVAYLYDSVCPAMRSAIAMTVAAAHSAGIKVGVCGEAASDPATAQILVELGVDSLSVSRI